MELTIKYKSKTQYELLLAMAQSFEDDSINMDKFLMWLIKQDSGDSIMMRQLKMMLDI